MTTAHNGVSSDTIIHRGGWSLTRPWPAPVWTVRDGPVAVRCRLHTTWPHAVRWLALIALSAAGVAAADIADPRRRLAAIVALAVVAFVVLAAVLVRTAPRVHARPGDLWLGDLVALPRGTRRGERCLRALLDAVDRPVVVTVDRDAPGLLAMYARLGFECVGAAGRLAVLRREVA